MDTKVVPPVMAARSAWVALALVMAGAAGLLALVVEPLRVVSGSMRPAVSSGDHVLIDKITGTWRPPVVGDVVVFKDPRSSQLSVKRIVALEGRSVAIEDGALVVDGAAQQEPAIDRSSIDSVYFGPVSVPEGTVFVMGDNRGESVDSRTFGPIAVHDLIGRVILVL